MTDIGKLEEKFKAANIPGYAIRKIEDNKIVFDDFAGVRAIGHEIRITNKDRWHIGSCTKSMTAFLIGILIDQGKMKFDDEISKVLHQSISEKIKNITIIDLLTHRSGLPEVVELGRLEWEDVVGSTEDTQTVRKLLVDAILNDVSKFSRDSKYDYCNSNYIILGEIIEQTFGKPWEQVMNEMIFSKLGMQDCGFGSPATKDLTPPDQPWGHTIIDDKIVAVPPKTLEAHPSDNPAALGPAGTVHCSLDAWTLFLKEMLRASRGHSTLLNPSTAETLFSLHKDSVAIGGWGCVQREWAHGPTYTMIGSNELNYAMYVIAPRRNMILMGTTNIGSDLALKVLVEQFKVLSDISL